MEYVIALSIVCLTLVSLTAIGTDGHNHNTAGKAMDTLKTILGGKFSKSN